MDEIKKACKMTKKVLLISLSIMCFIAIVKLVFDAHALQSRKDQEAKERKHLIWLKIAASGITEGDGILINARINGKAKIIFSIVNKNCIKLIHCSGTIKSVIGNDLRKLIIFNDDNLTKKPIIRGDVFKMPNIEDNFILNLNKKYPEIKDNSGKVQSLVFDFYIIEDESKCYDTDNKSLIPGRDRFFPTLDTAGPRTEIIMRFRIASVKDTETGDLYSCISRENHRVW